MKILFLNNFFYLRGGSERVLFEEMRLLQERGHETAIFTRAYPQNRPAPYERFFPEEIQRDKFGASLNGIKTVKELIYSRSARQGLRHLLKEFKPDIVHAHNIYGGLSTAVLDELKEQEIPAILTLHDLKLLCPSYLMLNHGYVCERCKGNKFYHALLTKCHKNSYIASAIYTTESYFSHMFRKYGSVSSFIAPSRFLLSKHQEFGFDTRKFVYIPNHIPLNDTAPSHQVGRHFLYFGRISREKGLRTLIKAYAKLQADLPLFIAGDGIDRSAMENMVAHEQNAQIKFIGYLTTEPLGRAIDEARAVILPSECYENAPMTILESFARGKPVIGARIGGIPEMINDGVNGYLFQPGNATDLQKKLVMFLNLPTRTVLEMGLAARKKVENEYSSESHYDRLMNVYLNVAQR